MTQAANDFDAARDRAETITLRSLVAVGLLSLLAVAALAAINFLFWWPLLVTSWNYWVGAS